MPRHVIMPIRNKRLLGFVFLSVLLHGVIALQATPAISLGGKNYTVLAVQLKVDQAARPVVSVQQQSKTGADTTSILRKSRVLTTARESQWALPQSVKETQASDQGKHASRIDKDKGDEAQTQTVSSHHRSSSDGQTRQHARAQIESLLFTRLARYFSYPFIARQRGWQGKVLLGFNVETDGSLGQIRVARSSGYAVLDHSALDSLNKVKTLADAGMLPRSRITGMQIPVIYRLED